MWSDVHALRGICDVVEFHKDGVILPVEYKRGRPKAHRADEIQICAQAICLEENFNLEPGGIGRGYLFYGKQQRRTEVRFDQALRALTLETAECVRAMLQSGRTPSAEYIAKRCDRCSLIHLCQPKALRLKRGAARWFKQQLDSIDSECAPT